MPGHVGPGDAELDDALQTELSLVVGICLLVAASQAIVADRQIRIDRHRDGRHSGQPRTL